MAALKQQREGDISLYVGIPFCPTRCIYCSFVSEAVEKSRHLLEPYLQALGQEISAVAEGLRARPRRIRTVYIGGGTPTTLDARQMEWLLTTLYREFDLSDCLEFTVEAGRPDTLDFEKLRVIRDCGATGSASIPRPWTTGFCRSWAGATTVRRCCGLMTRPCGQVIRTSIWI